MKIAKYDRFNVIVCGDFDSSFKDESQAMDRAKLLALQSRYFVEVFDTGNKNDGMKLKRLALIEGALR